MISAMERTEHENNSNTNEDTITPNQWLWLHLSTQLIYFVLFQFVSFMHIIAALHDKVFK